jgi:hypothetical protein
LQSKQTLLESGGSAGVAAALSAADAPGLGAPISSLAGAGAPVGSRLRGIGGGPAAPRTGCEAIGKKPQCSPACDESPLLPVHCRSTVVRLVSCTLQMLCCPSRRAAQRRHGHLSTPEATRTGYIRALDRRDGNATADGTESARAGVLEVLDRSGGSAHAAALVRLPRDTRAERALSSTRPHTHTHTRHVADPPSRAFSLGAGCPACTSPVRALQKTKDPRQNDTTVDTHADSTQPARAHWRTRSTRPISPSPCPAHSTPLFRLGKGAPPRVKTRIRSSAQGVSPVLLSSLSLPALSSSSSTSTCSGKVGMEAAHLGPYQGAQLVLRDIRLLEAK